MEQSDETSTREPDKAAIDASQPGSMTISADASAHVQASAFGDALLRLLQRIQKEDALVLSPLRLVLLTAELGNVVSRWQRALGLPELQLASAPFDKNDETLVPAAGSCANCPLRTGFNKLLFPDVRKDSCTSPDCFRAKIDAYASARPFRSIIGISDSEGF
jgi:hypothetical protein